MQKWVLMGLILCIWSPGLAQSPEFHHHRGDSLFDIGQYAESLEERFKAWHLVENSGSCEQKAIGLLQIGRSYYYLQNRQEASLWLQRSLEEAKRCQFDSLVGINYRNLGALFIEKNQPDSAILFLEEARKNLIKARNPTEMASLCAMMFEVHRKGKQNLQLARQWLDSCAYYNRLLNDPNQKAFYLMKEGIYWQDLKHYTKAESYFREAGNVYQSNSSIDGYMYALSCLARVQQEGGNFEKAYQTNFRLMAIRDTVFKEQTAKNLARYQTQFETQKKVLENLELRHQNERQFIFFGLGFLVLILGAFGIFKLKEASHRRKLDAQKREEQRLRFSEVVQAQEEERTRIARDLHDGLGHLMAAIKLNTSAIEVSDEQNQKILGQASEIIDQASKEVRQISHRLMPQSLSDLGLAASIRELATRLNESGKIRVEVKGKGEVSVEKQMAIGIYRIVQEVLNNALKHAEASLFTIRYGVENNEFILIFTDNGKGFEVEKMENSFGIGWKNIRSRVELLNGHLELKSKPGAGTIVEVTIPFPSNNVENE